MSAKQHEQIELAELKIARRRVADRYIHAYHKRAILRGDWDDGSILRDEIAAMRGEHSE